MLKLITATVLLAPLAHTDLAACRVSLRQVDWTEARMMLPASAPPSTLHVDLCVALDWSFSYENTSNLSGSICSVGARTITVQASFDPGFARDFVFATAVFQLPQIGVGVGVFDGTLDFAGSSGTSVHMTDQLLVTTDLAVSDPSYFLSPWPIYLRCVGSDWTTVATAGNNVQTFITLSGAGVVATYQ